MNTGNRIPHDPNANAFEVPAQGPNGYGTPHAPAGPWYARTWVRLAACFIFITTVPLAATAMYVTHRHIAAIRDLAAARQQDRVENAARRLEEILHTTRSDTLSFAEWPAWESYANASSKEDRDFWREKLGIQLRTFADLKPMYKNLVYSGEDGRDTLRVSRAGTVTRLTTSETTLDAPELSLLSRAIQLAPRQCQWEIVTKSWGESIYCAARVARAKPSDRSALWVELDGQALLAECEVADGSGSLPALYDNRGVLRIARPERAAVGIQAVNPPVPQQLSGTQRRQRVEPGGRFVSEEPVAMFPGLGVPRWRLAFFAPIDILDSDVHDFRAAFLTLLAAALLISIVLSVWIARQFTRPLDLVIRASRRIGAGDFDVQLSDDSGDEIGALAEQVGTMARQLKAAHDDFEQRLAEKTDQLIHAERLSTIGRTAAAVAHEINNPSGIISMYAQMLAEKLPADDPKRGKLNVIKEKAGEISVIVKELLDFSRKPPPRKEWLDLRQLVDDAMSDARLHGDNQQAPSFHPDDSDDAKGPYSEEITVDAAVAEIHADPHQMRRVLRNLINNARQAMASGGKLEVVATQHEGGVAIAVADNGPGIDEEQRKHLFDPFYTTKRFGAGTGLGLAISKGITESHQGRIDVQSTKGRGTTVTIWLPETRPASGR